MINEKNNVFLFFSESKFDRIDLFIKSREEFRNFSRNSIIDLIKNGNVKINDIVIKKPSISVSIGSKILVKALIQNSNTDHLEPFEYKLKILYENENIVIINKPRGLTVHPGAGNKTKTLVNILKWMGLENFSNLRGMERIGIVHRLDKDTSGLMIVAKNNNAHYLISEMIKKKEVERRYLCLCYGVPIRQSGKIENKIRRDNLNIKRMIIDNQNEAAKAAITNYYVIDKFFSDKFSLIECKLETGRTHQIRLHMMSIDSPIVGDQIYKTKNAHCVKGVDKVFADFVLNCKFQLLHSYSVSFVEPITGENISIKSLPLDFPINLNDYNL